jgi:hypothetical protein
MEVLRELWPVCEEVRAHDVDLARDFEQAAQAVAVAISPAVGDAAEERRRRRAAIVCVDRAASALRLAHGLRFVDPFEATRLSRLFSSLSNTLSLAA